MFTHLDSERKGDRVESSSTLTSQTVNSRLNPEQLEKQMFKYEYIHRLV